MPLHPMTDLRGSVSRAPSRAIYDDAVKAHEDLGHPCHKFVALQEGVPADRWQLPIPFMGASAQKGIVFLGFNPSWNADEDSPRWGCPFEKFDNYWRTVCDALPLSRWPLLYRRYQEIGERAVGPEFRLGLDAIVLEVVRYRSARSAGCDESVIQHELPTTGCLLQEVAPKVIVCSGANALWYLRELLPALKAELPDNFRVRAIEGKIFRTKAPWGNVFVIGSRHLTSGHGMTNQARLSLGDAVRDALNASLAA